MSCGDEPLSARADRVGSTVLASTELDCAAKIRLKYRLPDALDRAWVKCFELDPTSIVRIDEFSAWVAGAHDHVTVVGGERWLAKGAFGLSQLMVTFFRTRKDEVERHIAEFERQAFDGYGWTVERRS